MLRRFQLPEPRIGLGIALRGIATACIDVSDGLAGDLAKLCAASGVGARLDCLQLPLSAAVARVAGEVRLIRYALTGGDDYELLFTAPVAARAHIKALGEYAPLRLIGDITAAPGVRLEGAGARARRSFTVSTTSQSGPMTPGEARSGSRFRPV